MQDHYTNKSTDKSSNWVNGAVQVARPGMGRSRVRQVSAVRLILREDQRALRRLEDALDGRADHA